MPNANARTFTFTLATDTPSSDLAAMIRGADALHEKETHTPMTDRAAELLRLFEGQLRAQLMPPAKDAAKRHKPGR